MKNIINKLVFGSLTVALSSCIGNYENINSNPYEAPDLSADGYALGSAMNNLAGCVDITGCKYSSVHRLLVGRTFRRIFCRF